MQKALFLHTQKTAGTSVQHMARHVYGNKSVASHADYVALGLKGCEKLNFVSGHFGMAFARPLMKDRYSFTFLRDPVERLLSLHSFYLKRDAHTSELYAAAQRLDLDDFLRLGLSDNDTFRQVLWNTQTWQLAHGWGARLAGVEQVGLSEFEPQTLLVTAKAALNEFSYVGLVETFDADIGRIFSDLGAAGVAPRRSNVSERRTSAKGLPKSTRALLHELTHLDRELYWHASRMRGLWFLASAYLSQLVRRGLPG